MVPAMKNTTDERGMNPIHVAAANGRLDCVKWLAVSGVDLAEETPTGYTAMHLAAMNGHVNCMMVSSTHVICGFYSSVTEVVVMFCFQLEGKKLSSGEVETSGSQKSIVKRTIYKD